MKKIFRNIKNFDLLLALLVMIYFFYIFFKYTINIPLNDDYDVINNFNDILDASSFTDKLQLFYLQHNEHRILYDKFWFYVSYWFSPEGLNFNFLSFIGNLSLLALVVFYYLKLRKEYSNYFILFPLAVFLCNLAFWENLTFSMSTLANLTFVLFVLLSLNYITKKETTNKDFFLSILFFGLSLLTQGGGVFVFPVALLVLAFKRNKTQFLKYTVFGALLTFGYFVGYHKHPTPGIAEITGNLLLHFKFFLAFLGSAVANYHFFPDNNDQAIFRSIVLGSLFFAFYIYLFIRKYYKRNLFNFSVMTLVMVISFVTAITRLSMGIQMAAASRYRLLSVVFIISIFIYVLEIFKSKNYKKEYTNGILILVSTAYLFFFNFNGTNESLMSFRKRASLIGVLNYFSNDNSLLNSPKQEFSAEVLKRANKSGAFVLNENLINSYFPFANPIELKSIMNESSLVDVTRIENIKQLKDSYYIEGYASLEQYDTKNQKVYIILVNNGKQVAFMASEEFRPGLSIYFNAPNVDYGGFNVRIKNEDINKGKNEIFILIQNDGKSKVITTDKSLIKE